MKYTVEAWVDSQKPNNIAHWEKLLDIVNSEVKISGREYKILEDTFNHVGTQSVWKMNLIIMQMAIFIERNKT